MITQKEIQIGKHIYVVDLLNAEDALDAFGNISNLFFPVLGILGDEIVNTTEGFETEIFTALSTSISYALKDKEVRDVAKGLLKTVWKNGKEINVSEEFKGNFSGYTKLVVFAFKENFLDFFLDSLEGLGLDLTSVISFKDKLVEMLKKSSEKLEEDAQSETKTSSSLT